MGRRPWADGRRPMAVGRGPLTEWRPKMSLEQTLSADIAAAMKSKDATRLSALRMLKAALMNKGVEKNRPLEPSEEFQVVATLVKQRRDSIEQFSAGGRKDLADKEAAEIDVGQLVDREAPIGGPAREQERQNEEDWRDRVADRAG